MPSTGTIVALELPDDVRVDSGVEAGGEVSPFYDAMIAKLIAHAPARDAALDRLAGALDRTLVAGRAQQCRFPRRAVPGALSSGKATVDTGFIDRNLGSAWRGAARAPTTPPRRSALCGCSSSEGARRRDERQRMADSPWAAQDGFQLGGKRSLAMPIVIDGESASATVAYGKDGLHVTIDGAAPATDARAFEAGDEAYVLRHGRQTRVRLQGFFCRGRRRRAPATASIKAPMHGRVLELLRRRRRTA